MESKLKKEAVKQYSKTFSSQICHQAFQQQEKLGGQDILSLTTIKQVNLFIIKELFLHWKTEVERLKSPYFNYEAEEVKAALANFMDIVSQNILVEEVHLRPLLEKATQDTLYLLLAPYDYYYLVLTHSDRQSWTVPELEEILKYVRINRALLERLVNRCRQESLSVISVSRVSELFSHVFDQLDEPPEDTEPYLRQFNEQAPLQSESLFSTTVELKPINQPSQSPKQEEPKSDANKDLNLRTLNDYLNKTDRSTLADIHQQRKIESLTKHISVNQKFMFIRELFNNEPDAFRKAVEQLDAQNSYAEAVNLIRRDLAQQYRWKMDSEEVLEFMELLSKRF